MIALKGLPDHVVRLIQSADVAEFTTMTAAGVPLDTPLLPFPAEDLSTIDFATGVAYPAKAERVRRNPKVGLLFEGALPGEPTVSIAGMAATRDSDIAANALRYIAETGAYGGGMSAEWSLQYKAVWYWARILMEVTPKQILWWDDHKNLDGPPNRWDAPEGTVFPASDPAPPSKGTAAPKWSEEPWQQRGQEALGRGAPGHLSLMDADGFPRPMRAHDIVQTGEGFTLRIARGAPWARSGKASLTFQGRETFIGAVSAQGDLITMTVERALPVLPMVADRQELWTPSPHTREGLVGRLQAELDRRGQPMPVIPQVKPTPTAGGLRRAARNDARAKA